MKKMIGNIIYKARKDRRLTQDEFGGKYNVSGPAIFKFEKGYVRPSIGLWMKIATDLELSEKWAILLWLKSTVPKKYQDFIELQWADGPATGAKRGRPSPKRADYRKCRDRSKTLEVAREDESMPRALREFLEDDEMWAVYKPTGTEINGLIDNLSDLGRGTKSLYSDGLQVYRLFKQA